MKKYINKASILIEALPYIQKLRGEIIVIKFGGSVMEDSELMKSTMRDIVLMECVGMRPVVVHGGGDAISAKLTSMGIETKFINGLRFTCDRTVNVVDDVLHNEINPEIVKAIKAAGGKGHQLSGKKFLKAKKMFTTCQKTGEQLDIGFVGDIFHVDTKHIFEAVKSNMIPVIPPLACDEKGQVYNINADIAACKIAEALKAKKLVFLSDVPGILQDPKDEETVISTVKTSEVETLIERGIIKGGMVPKVKSAVHAINAGTDKVHMIDGRMKHSLLLEIFTDKGIGTEIIDGLL
ncbi:MAG TPA: acetylglutamate kinase [Lentisphaeria bacterium]|nr:acetylglutamate kinase [Lentisphaeria bacterium]